MRRRKLMPRAISEIDRRLVTAVLLVLGSVSARPSSRALAASEGNDDGPARPTQRATLRPVAATAPDIPFSNYDAAAEQVLLDLANQARAKAGAPALTI